ncbi:unnamed protein product [Chironomus riparius]|uniref:Uncharacterized protein n=1 Tax=Chironomus riparius TaxID=315576 RepID=A0A9N9S9P7_9DIPT|nr:unnamed protein product [Chironomus riparius]
MAVAAKNVAMKSSKIKWLRDLDNLEVKSPDQRQDRSREIWFKIKLYLQNLPVIRNIRLDFRFGDNRTSETLGTQHVTIPRIYEMVPDVPPPPVIRPEEWEQSIGTRDNQGLGSVRRNNEIFQTSSTNPPTNRQESYEISP